MVYVLGGTQAWIKKHTYFTNMWSYDPSSFTWFRNTIHGELADKARSRYSCGIIGQNLYIFGGADEADRYQNDLHVVNLPTESKKIDRHDFFSKKLVPY